MDFLHDYTFLQKLNRYRVKEYWVTIGILDFQTEKLLSRIQGKVTGGNMTIAASSPTRRSGTLNIVFDEDLRNITDVQNLIAIDKKVQINIGITNPFYTHNINNFNSKEEYQYMKYGDILWFPQGIFIITKVSSQQSTSSSQISINFVDKMALLNGTCGGVIPATVSFHEQLVMSKNGETSTDYPLISTIIRECVQHFGGEHPSKIIVSDIEDVGRQVLKYQGTTPIRFCTYNGVKDTLRRAGGNFVISDTPQEGFDDVYYKGDIVGYLETPLTFPGELIKKAGSTVTQVLDDIVNALGNFEYFYDIEGVFHFQKKRNYVQTGNVPLNFGMVKELRYNDNGVAYDESVDDDSLHKLYLPIFQTDSFLNEFTDTELVSQINFNPNYDTIKNDYIVWGTKNSNNDTSQVVRYHLAIDERPKDAFDENGESTSLCNKYIYAVIEPPKAEELTEEEQEEMEKYYEEMEQTGAFPPYLVDPSQFDTQVFRGTIVRYQTTCHIKDPNRIGYKVVPCCIPLKELFPDLPKEYWFNWREELYRMALLNYGNSTNVEISSDGAVKQMGEHYFEELRSEWRLIYNPMSSIRFAGKESFEQKWKETFGDDSTHPWTGYHVDVAKNPGKVRYWLDIIDSSDEIGKYSISRIGRRSVIKENSQINELYQNAVNDIVFIDASNEDWKFKESGNNVQDRIAYYDSIGQTWCILNASRKPLFEVINSYGTCFEDIRQLVYQNLIYNSTITMSCIPLFYLDVNRIIRLNFPKSGIKGDYVINQITWNIGATATMNLSLQEALVIN